MRWVAEEVAEADVDEPVGPVGRQRHAELLHQSTPVGRGDDRRGAGSVRVDACVTEDGYLAEAIEHRLGTGDVVEVGVHHGNDGAIGDRGQFVERLVHLLVRLASVDGDDAVRSFDKALIGQAIADQAPNAGAHCVHAPFHELRLSNVGRVSDTTIVERDRVRGVGGERTTWSGSCIHGAETRC